MIKRTVKQALRMLGLGERHDWGDVHFWIAVALAAGVMIHLLLHVQWIKTCSVRYLLPFRALRRSDAPPCPM